MSAIHAAVSWGLNQVSMTARRSIVLEIIRAVREAFFLSNGTNVSVG